MSLVLGRYSKIRFHHPRKLQFLLDLTEGKKLVIYEIKCIPHYRFFS